MDPQAKLSTIPVESLIGAAIALIFLGLFFTVLFRTYWLWYKKNSGKLGKQSSFNISGRKPTLFDVRELISRGEKPMAIKVYRQIFKVDQKEAQRAVDALEKNLRP